MLEFSGKEILTMLVGGLAFLSALTVGVILISIMCRLCWRWGALDKPDGTLKFHFQPTATLGGIPLFLSILAGIGVLFPLGHRFSLFSFQVGDGIINWLPLLIAGVFILLMGIKDDLHHIAPQTKISFQILASMIFICSGLMISRMGFFGMFEVSLGILAFPFTLFWLVGSCNAFNFIDGMDGLASGLGVVMALFLAGFGIYHGAYGPAVIALAAAGGLTALLLFNFKPALIFLGDSGSQLVGLLLGALAIKTVTAKGVFALPSAGILLSIPVLDALLSILRRYSRAAPMARGDHHHIHHCLRRRGISVRRVALILPSVTIVCGAMAWFCLTRSGGGVAIIAITFVFLQLYIGIRLGCLEPQQLIQRMLGRRPALESAKAQVEAGISGMGITELSALWERMKPVFEKMDLDRAVLTLEGISKKGRQRFKTYKWIRSDALVTEKVSHDTLPGSRWTKRFPLNGDESQIATLRLESMEKSFRAGVSASPDEQRISWLLKQISENIRSTYHPNMSGATMADPFMLSSFFHSPESATEDQVAPVDAS